MSDDVEISVVVPCLNEEANVVAIIQAVTAQLEKSAVEHEIVIIDNGSTDDTVRLAKEICALDPRVRLIVNNQNYGQMRSPTHAIYQTLGRAVIGICADFQDPPELIPQFIERWRAGAKIVLGVRADERTSLGTRLMKFLGYEIFARFGDYPVIRAATGFGLYDRDVVDTLKQWRDPEPFFRGMVVESGFGVETISYVRPGRAGGESKNNFATLLSFAISGLAGSSKKLLRLPLYIAFLLLTLVPVSLVAIVALAVTGRVGWAWLWLAALMFVVGLIFLFLGLIGEQIRVISQIVRNVPLVIEKERLNFTPPGVADASGL